MLHRSRNSEEGLFINLTPMIDVILTLLLFFMAATKLYDWDERSFDVSVPKVGNAQPLTPAPDPLILVIEKDGTVSLRGERMGLPELKQQLADARKNYPEQEVVLRADGETLHQHVADVMSACHAAGIERLSISVREIKGE